MPRPRLRQLPHDAIDLGFRSDVDAARGFVEDEARHLAYAHPAADQDLLPIAARKRRDAPRQGAPAMLYSLIDAAAQRSRSAREWSRPKRGNRSSVVALTFCATFRYMSRPCDLRSSVTKPSPRRMAAVDRRHALRARRRLRSCRADVRIAPEDARGQFRAARAGPCSQMSTISPARTVSDRRTRGCSRSACPRRAARPHRREWRAWADRSPTSRPTIILTRPSRVVRASPPAS